MKTLFRHLRWLFGVYADRHPIRLALNLAFMGLYLGVFAHLVYDFPLFHAH